MKSKRDDIRERQRRKRELRVLAGGACIKPGDDSGDENGVMPDAGNVDSEEDFYKQVQEAREAKFAAKAEMYSKCSSIVSRTNWVKTETMDRRRQITCQMEKNRGLTRPRNKAIKSPRKKYKKMHQKEMERRKGQVREVKKPIGHYGGEASGINAGISRSIRFKN